MNLSNRTRAVVAVVLVLVSTILVALFQKTAADGLCPPWNTCSDRDEIETEHEQSDSSMNSPDPQVMALRVDRMNLRDFDPDLFIESDEIDEYFVASDTEPHRGLVLSRPYLLSIRDFADPLEKQKLISQLITLLRNKQALTVLDATSDDITMVLGLFDQPTPWDPIGRYPPSSAPWDSSGQHIRTYSTLDLAPSQTTLIYHINHFRPEEQGWSEYNFSTVPGRPRTHSVQEVKDVLRELSRGHNLNYLDPSSTAYPP